MKIKVNFYDLAGFMKFSKTAEVKTIPELIDFIELQEDIKREDFLVEFYEDLSKEEKENG